MADNEVKIVITSQDKTNLTSTVQKFRELREIGEKISSIGMRLTGFITAPVMLIVNQLRQVKEIQDALKPISDEFGKITLELVQGLLPVIRDLMPSIMSIVKGIGDLVKQFNSLSLEQKENILRWIGIAAAIGPVLVAVGQLVNMVGTLGMLLGNPIFLEIGLIIAGIVVIVWKWNDAMTTLVKLMALAARGWWLFQGNQKMADLVMQGATNLLGPSGAIGGGSVSAQDLAKSAGLTVVNNYNSPVTIADQQKTITALRPYVQQITGGR